MKPPSGERARGGAVQGSAPSPYLRPGPGPVALLATPAPSPHLRPRPRRPTCAPSRPRRPTCAPAPAPSPYLRPGPGPVALPAYRPRRPTFDPAPSPYLRPCPAALPAASPPYLRPSRPTCGPTALTCSPRRPHLRSLPPLFAVPAALTCGPAAFPAASLSAAAPPATRAARAASPSRAANRRAAVQQHSQAAQQLSSRTAEQPSRPAAEPPSSQAAEPPCSRAAVQPSRRAALPPSRPSSPVRVLAFDAEGRAIDFDVWVDDLQLFLQCDRADGLSLFDLTSGASPAPAADADATVRSQWATSDAAARLAVRRHLPTSELTRLPDSLRVVRDHFLSVCPTTLTVDLLEKSLLAAEKSIVAVGASRGDPRTPIFEGCSPSPLLPSVASAAAADLLGLDSVGAASAPSGRRRSGKGKGAGALEERAGAVEVEVEAAGGVGVAVGVEVGVEVSVAAVQAEAAAAMAVEAEVAEVVAVEEAAEAAVVAEAAEAAEAAGWRCCWSWVYAEEWLRWWSAPAAAARSDEGDCYRSFPPDPVIETAALGTGEAAALGANEAAALGASASASSGAGESALAGTASASASLTFTLYSGASRSFFRDRTTLTPLGRPVAVSLADPSGDPVLSHFSTVLPCPAAPSGTLSGLYLPSFSTNLVSGADLQDAGIHQFTPASQRVTHCSDARTGRHLATFTRRPGSSLYTLTTESPPVPTSGQVAASGQVFAAASRSGPESAPCSCRLLSHETLLWHHRLDHPSLPRLRGMASRVLVSGLPRSLPPLPPGPGPTCVPCVEGRLRAAPHYSQFPPTEAPLQTLHMDVWGPDMSRGLHAGDLPSFAVDGKVGDASAFRVWGSRAFVRDLSADKLSPRAAPCVFLGFPPDAPG
ncbi:unnamed protein product, partial [Closterium sp. NIES-64]